jgi:hypothetical protein
MISDCAPPRGMRACAEYSFAGVQAFPRWSRTPRARPRTRPDPTPRSSAVRMPSSSPASHPGDGLPRQARPKHEILVRRSGRGAAVEWQRARVPRVLAS